MCSADRLGAKKGAVTTLSAKAGAGMLVKIAQLRTDSQNISGVDRTVLEISSGVEFGCVRVDCATRISVSETVLPNFEWRGKGRGHRVCFWGRMGGHAYQPPLGAEIRAATAKCERWQPQTRST